MPIALEDKLRARRTLPPVSLRRLLREEAGATPQDVADEVKRLLAEESGTPQTCTAQAVRYWESGDRQPRGRYLVAYSRVLEALREAAS